MIANWKDKLKGLCHITNFWDFLVFILILLIIVHGFWPNFFRVDEITIIMLVFLFLPILAHYLKRAKILGVELEFREKVEKIDKIIQRSIDKAKDDEKIGKYKISPFETFKISGIKKLLELESDPSLALASLQIEIERKLNKIVDCLNGEKRDGMPLFRIIEELGKKEILYPEQMRALREIIILCKKAIHGYPATKEDAEGIINLIDKLNMSFPIGYSLDIFKNLDYKKHGLVCEWEHCIELMPLTNKRTKKSCLLFGHNCPEGIKRVENCSKMIKDFSKKI